MIPPTVSGASPVIGHLPEFLRKPEQLMQRGYREHGGLFSLAMPGRRAVVLLGMNATASSSPTSRNTGGSVRSSFPGSRDGNWRGTSPRWTTRSPGSSTGSVIGVSST